MVRWFLRYRLLGDFAPTLCIKSRLRQLVVGLYATRWSLHAGEKAKKGGAIVAMYGHSESRFKCVRLQIESIEESSLKYKDPIKDY